MEISNFFKPQTNYNKKDTQLNVFYFNDIHGDIHRLGNLAKAHDCFEKQSNATKLTVTSGDFLYGQNAKRNNLILDFLNKIKVDFATLGNHEFDGGTEKLANYLDTASFQTVCSNIRMEKNNKLKERLKDKKLVQSAVWMKDGKKFGVIGLAPNNEKINSKDRNNNATIALNTKETISEINKETSELEKQGINKIILLSHMGYETDVELAQQTKGVDVIIGGHSHDEIDGVDDKNLFMSKRNEPVVITQAGKNNQKVGFLDVVFNPAGILKTLNIKNTIADVDEWKANPEVNDLCDRYLGKNEKLARTTKAFTPKNEAAEREDENPIANVLTDAMIWTSKGNADVSLLNSGTIKGGFEKEITAHDILYNNLPYNDDILLIDGDEKLLVDLLNKAASSVYDKDPNSSDLLQTAGMSYTTTPNGISKIVLNNGREIDPQNPTDRPVKLALNRYLFQGEYTSALLEDYEEDAEVIGDLQTSFMNYLKDQEEIDVKKDGRIHVIK